MNVESLLLELPMMEKLAVVENPDQQQLEQDFGRLAYAFLKDRAPRMIEYLIGFETVEAAPDGSRSVGLFGFKVGENVYYIPVFFMNNQIKGMDSIYSRKDDMFMPLTESNINTLVTKQTTELGQPGDAVSRESFTVPDFSALVYPPQLGAGGRDSGSAKSGWAISRDAAGMMADMKAQFIKMAGDSLVMLSKDAETREMFAGLVLSLSGTHMGPSDIKTSKLAQFICNVGGPDSVVKIASAMRDPRFAAALCHFYDHNQLLNPAYDKKFAAKTAAEAKIKIISEKCDVPVPEETAKKIITQGFAIEDKREPGEKTEMFEYSSATDMSNPTEPGNYDVLMTSGISKCDVYQPNIPSIGKRIMLLVDKDGNWTTAHSRRVFVNGARLEPEDRKTPFDKGKDAEKMEVGKEYILVNKDMKSTLPLRIKTIVKTGDDVRYVVDFCDNVFHDLDSDSDSGGIPDSPYSSQPRTYGVSLYLSPTAGSIRLFADQIVIPKDSWKAIELAHTDSYGDDGRELCKAFRPATYAEVAEDLTKVGCHELLVESRDEGVAYAIRLDELMDGDHFTYKSACIRLVRDYGLPVEGAEAMLKQAGADIKSRRMVKFAQVPMSVIPPQIPSYNDQGYDSTLGIPTQVGQYDYTMGETVAPGPMPSGPGTNFNVGGEATRQQGGAIGSNTTAGNSQNMSGSPTGNAGDVMGMDVNQLAQMAAQSGQRQVFDQSVIGGMARIYDTNNVIDATLPEMGKLLDKLGRLLFLFYWKNEDWQERYGSQDQNSMEDQLRSNYKSLGDLMLKLKQKGITDEDQFFI